MKKPSLIITGLGVALALFVGTTFYFQNTNSTSPSHSAASDTLTQGSSAMWISSAESVDEVTKEADLIVRARVVKSPESRVLRETLPRVEVSNGKSIVVGEEVSESVFSDTMFEVVQTYVGKSTSEIMVVQTGGPNPNNPNNIMQMVDDPLYQVGEEYILFLVIFLVILSRHQIALFIESSTRRDDTRLAMVLLKHMVKSQMLLLVNQGHLLISKHKLCQLRSSTKL